MSKIENFWYRWKLFFGLLWRDSGGFTENKKYHRATISLSTAREVSLIQYPKPKGE